MDSYLFDYCQKWSNVCRNYASHNQSVRFADLIVNELINEEPWKGMSDRKLKQKAMLYCGTTKRSLKKVTKLLASDKLTSDEKNTLRIRQAMYEREIRSYTEIVRSLREDHGRKISKCDNHILMRIAQVRQRGISGSLQTVYRKALNLIH